MFEKSSSATIVVAVICCSFTVNLGILYRSGILDKTAANLHEMSRLTGAVARVAGGIANYFDLAHRIDQLEYQRALSGTLPDAFSQVTIPPLLEQNSAKTDGWSLSAFCPRVVCG